MNQFEIKPDQDAASVDVMELVHTVWSQRVVIFCCTAAALLIAVIYLHIASYVYTATSNVTPLPSSGGGGISSKLGSLGGLAEMAGVSLPTGSGSDQFQLFLEGLHSRFAADGLAKNTGIMKVLYSGEWDEGSHGWRRPASAISFVVRLFKPILGFPNYPYEPPDGARLQDYLVAKVHVTQDAKTPVVTITYDHRDPLFAVEFLKALDKVVDEQLRQKALSRSAQNIAYLSEKLKSVTIAEQREALAQTLSEQEKSAMMANSGAPFAVEAFGEPFASYRPTQPQPVMVLATALLAGIFIGIGLAFASGYGWLDWLKIRLRKR
jgi:uncharacterized protein involved in exopolysaccharide biosynthesis